MTDHADELPPATTQAEAVPSGALPPADPPPSRPPPRPRRPRGDGGLGFAKDNLEAIAVAIVMALVIKHFCVEAFKIPTSSMRPTLLGENDNLKGEGDRILVDKWAYLLTPPERWHVIVFRYPLNRARNFIKRIAFLPNEHGHISNDGDLWVRPAGDDKGDEDLRIPPKRRDVRNRFYRAVYPPTPAIADDEEDDEEDGENPFRVGVVTDYWRAEQGEPNGWRLESHDRYTFQGGSAASLRAANKIREYSRPDNWHASGNSGQYVRDVRFQMQARLDPVGEGVPVTPTRVTLRWRPDSEFLAVMTLHTVARLSKVFIRRGTEVVAEATLGVALTPGGTRAMEMEYVDGRLYAHVDGNEIAVLSDKRTFADTLSPEDDGDQTFHLEAEGGALHIEGMTIDRDLRYENSWDANPGARRRGVTVPADSYFMLGDNTRNSSDSRRWRLVTIHLRGGRTIKHDYQDSPDYDDTMTWKEITDADGLTRRWPESAEDEDIGGRPQAAPFVHRDLIVGRAFLVFWPWTPTFPGRIGFIH